MTGKAKTAPRVTLKDVAAQAGVHPGTASRALNDSTRALVNSGTAERVLRAADDLGYRPNPIARGLKTSRSYTVGVIIPDLMNPLFPPIVRGIQDKLEDAGYTPLIANTDNDPDREVADFEAMRARQVDGIITATARLHHGAATEGLMEGDPPVVLINRRDGSLPAVTVDDRAGIKLAVDHVVGLGHTRIAHACGPQNLSTGRLRREGFIEAMEANGLEADRSLMPVADAFIESEGERLCRLLLNAEPAPTAIVAANDTMALGCYDVLADRGIDCPGEISVTGFNDMPFSDRFDPPMTTIHIPHYDMGGRAAELLLARLEGDGEAAGPPDQVELQPELVVRGSTGSPREQA